MTEFEVVFKWPMTVEAESESEAKEVAPDVLLDHLRQVRLKKSDFEVIEESQSLESRLEEIIGHYENGDGDFESLLLDVKEAMN